MCVCRFSFACVPHARAINCFRHSAEICMYTCENNGSTGAYTYKNIPKITYTAREAMGGRSSGVCIKHIRTNALIIYEKCVFVCVSVFAAMYQCMYYTHHMHMCVWACVCVCVCVCVSSPECACVVCIHTQAHKCMHTHTHTPAHSYTTACIPFMCGICIFVCDPMRVWYICSFL
jgi:hypothetical protein